MGKIFCILFLGGLPPIDVLGQVISAPAVEPKVSVVVPHFGDPETPAALLESLKRQVGVTLQIIVVDDASPIPLGSRDGVTVLRREENGGFGTAVNTGAKLASHPLLLILNSDLQISESYVVDLVRASAPWQPAVTSTQLTSNDGSTQWVGRHFPTIRHQTIEWLTPLARWRGRLHNAVGHNTLCVDGAVQPVDWLVGAVLLIPTQIFSSVGGFDEFFYMNCEEVDLQRRLRQLGVPAIFIGTVSAIHASGGSSDSGKRRRWLVESRLKYAAKWGNEQSLRIALHFASAVNLVFNTARQLLGRDIDAASIFAQEVGLLKKGSE